MNNLKNLSLAFSKEKLPILTIFFIVILFFYKVFLGYAPLSGDIVIGAYYPWLDYKWGYPVGVPVKNPITSDVVSFIYPMQTAAISIIKNGQWPLWNPYILTGTPLLANFQTAAFSPVNIVYWLTDDLSAWTVQIIFQHIAAAIFTYILLRNWKISQLSSVLGSLVYAFSGFNLIWSQWNGHTLSAAYIPLIILSMDKFFSTFKAKWGALFSITLCLQLFSGYPQSVLYTILAGVIFWFINIRLTKQFLITTLLLSLFGLVGLGLSMPQVLPGYELTKYSQRDIEPHPYEWAFLPYEKMITFFAPDYFGNHSTANYWGPQDYTSNTGYVGVIALLLSTFGLNKLFKSKNQLFALAISVVALIFSLPTFMSIFIWERGYLGLQAASAHRALVLWCFGISLLASFGAEYLLNSKSLKLNKYFYILNILIFSILGFTFYKYHTSDILFRNIEVYYIGLRNLVIPISILTISIFAIYITKFKILKKIYLLYIFILLCLLESFYFGWKFTPFTKRKLVFPTTPIIDFVKNQQNQELFRMTGTSVVPINMLMEYEVEVVEGYDAVYPYNIAKFLAALNSNKANAQALGRYALIDNTNSRLLDLVNTKYYLSLEINNKKEETFKDKSTLVYQSDNFLSRFESFSNWEVIPKDEHLEKLLDNNFDIYNTLLITENINIFKPSDNFESEINLISKTTQSYKLKTNTNENSLLFFSITDYPGWKAYIDDFKTDIITSDYAYQSIVLPQGEHTIDIVYDPDSFKKGVILAQLSLLGLAALSYTLYVKYEK